MIHLIVSEDEWLADERVEQLVGGRVEGGAELLALEADAGEVPALEEALFAPSLFTTERVVVVRHAERLQSAGLKRLSELCARADGDTVLIVVAVADRPPAALQRSMQGIAKSERLSRPKRGELVAWVTRRMRSAGVTPGKDAAGLLIEALGPSLRDLAHSVDQLALRAGRGKIVEAKDVLASFPGLAEQPVWALYDALLARDGRKAYRVLHALHEQGNDPIGILFALVGQNRHVMRAKSVLERSPAASDGSLASALAVSPARAGVLRRQAAQVSWEWVCRLHHECAAADFDLKGGDEVRIVGLLPPEIVLERLLDRALPAIEVVAG